MSDMREALEAAFTEEEKHDATQVETEVVSEPAADSTPAVEESAASEPAVEEKAAPVDAAGKKVEVPVEKQEPSVQPGQHRVDRAPASWKKEAKGEWAALPLHVRQEVYRREMEVNRALQEAAPARQFQQEFEKTVAPYMARLQSLNATPQQAFQHLLNADYQLASGTPQQKAQLLDKLIQDYGIDIAELDKAISARLGGQQQPTPTQPDIAQLVQQQLQQALAPIYQQQQQAQQRQQQEAAMTVEQMSLDPQYPFFDELRDEMADLIEVASRRGVVLSLEQAYHKAAQLNPDVAGQLQRQTTMNQAQQTHQQAQRAKAAASSVSGAPAGGGNMEFSGDGSLRGAVEAAFANARL